MSVSVGTLRFFRRLDVPICAKVRVSGWNRGDFVTNTFRKFHRNVAARKFTAWQRLRPNYSLLLTVLLVFLANLSGCGSRPDRFKATGAANGSTGAKEARGLAPAGSAGTACKPVDASDGGTINITGRVRFAVLGDYGSAGQSEARVAALVKGWTPDFIITTGDNNYPGGGADTIDANIGQYFQEYIAHYRGKYGCGAAQNRFFPSLGNHDWYTPDAKPYRDYFSLPGNERYYDVVVGDVHLFAIDSDLAEPDGVTHDSVQASWLKARLGSSTATWRVVYMHHPPYSSGSHQSSTYMRWPYKEWGAHLVFAGHDHIYERLNVDGLPYIVNGLGGTSIYAMSTTLPESISLYNANFGAVLIDATANELFSQFFTVEGQLIDQLRLVSAP